MDNLPTNYELNKLLQQRGREALACYALRSALRALCFIGDTPIAEIWPESTAFNAFIGLGAIIGCYGMRKGVLNSANIRSHEEVKASCNQSRKCHFALTAVYHAYVVVLSTDPCLVCRNAEMAASNCRDAAGDLTELVCEYASRDYEVLTGQVHTASFLFNKLWWEESPKTIESQQMDLIASLSNLSLSKLASNIAALWHCELNLDHIERYYQNISGIYLRTAHDIEQVLSGAAQLEKNYAVRLLLLGPGGAGKTSLFQMLTKGCVSEVIEPTVGIECAQHCAINLKQLINDGTNEEIGLDNIKLFPWDFGGQTIFHSLHNAFMHENCVYVVVVDSRHEQSPDEWLGQISHITGHPHQGNVTVLIVTNWFDNIQQRQNENALLRKFGHLIDATSFFHFPCRNESMQNEEFIRFARRLAGVASQSQKMVTKDTFNAMKVVNDIYRNTAVFSKDEFISWITGRINGLEKDEECSDLLTQLELFCCYIPLKFGDNMLYFDPAKLIECSYQIINHAFTQKNGGLVSLDDLVNVLPDLSGAMQEQASPDSSEINIKHVIAFLSKYDLCVSLANEQFFFPDAAAPGEPLGARDLIQHASLRLFYDLEYIPSGVKATVVSMFHRNDGFDIDLQQGVWRTGMIVLGSFGDNNCKAVIEFLPRKHRIVISLIGEINEACGCLLAALDNQLCQHIPRDHLGYFQIISTESLDIKTLVNNSNEILLTTPPKEGAICIYNNSYISIEAFIMGNNYVNTGNNAVVGENNHVTSAFNKDSNNQNTYSLSAEDKAFMQQVINETIAKAAQQNLPSDVLQNLVEVQQLVSSSEGELVVERESLKDKIVGKFWPNAKEVNTAYSMIKNSAEIVAAILALLVG